MRQTSDFETAAEILKTLDLSFDDDYENNLEKLFGQWNDIVGEKIGKYSKPKTLTDDGILIVTCDNSIVANELVSKREFVNKKIKKLTAELKISGFRYIKITYSR